MQDPRSLFQTQASGLRGCFSSSHHWATFTFQALCWALKHVVFFNPHKNLFLMRHWGPERLVDLPELKHGRTGTWAQVCLIPEPKHFLLDTSHFQSSQCHHSSTEVMLSPGEDESRGTALEEDPPAPWREITKSDPGSASKSVLSSVRRRAQGQMGTGMTEWLKRRAGKKRWWVGQGVRVGLSPSTPVGYLEHVQLLDTKPEFPHL